MTSSVQLVSRSEYEQLRLRLQTEMLRYLDEDANPPVHRKY